MRSISLILDSKDWFINKYFFWENRSWHGWDADDEEIQSPPTTHLVAIVDDLTDMLDYDSEDIDNQMTG